MILLSISIISTPGRADALRDALDQKNKAYNDYYKGYKALGENPSSAQLSELRAKTISSAQASWAKELNNTVHQREVEIRQTIFDAIKKQVPEAAMAKWITDPMSAFKSIQKKIFGKSSTNPGASGTTPVSTPDEGARRINPPFAPPPPAGPSDEGPIIDGSQFPKELFFPGGQK